MRIFGSYHGVEVSFLLGDWCLMALIRMRDYSVTIHSRMEKSSVMQDFRGQLEVVSKKNVDDLESLQNKHEDLQNLLCENEEF